MEMPGYPALSGDSPHLGDRRGQPSTLEEESITIWSKAHKLFSINLKAVKQSCSDASSSQNALKIWKLEFMKYLQLFKQNIYTERERERE